MTVSGHLRWLILAESNSSYFSSIMWASIPVGRVSSFRCFVFFALARNCSTSTVVIPPDIRFGGVSTSGSTTPVSLTSTGSAIGSKSVLGLLARYVGAAESSGVSVVFVDLVEYNLDCGGWSRVRSLAALERLRWPVS